MLIDFANVLQKVKKNNKNWEHFYGWLLPSTGVITSYCEDSELWDSDSALESGSVNQLQNKQKNHHLKTEMQKAQIQ